MELSLRKICWLVEGGLPEKAADAGKRGGAKGGMEIVHRIVTFSARPP